MTNKRRIAGKLAAVGAAGTLSAALCAGASTPVRAGTFDDLLDLLKAKGSITQTEYQKLKARHQAEENAKTDQLRAAESRASAAEAMAREAQAKASEQAAHAAADAKVSQKAANTAVAAKTQTQATADAVAKTRALTLSAADMPVPPMARKAPIAYVTVLPNCVGIRVGEVDICTKGDLSFFGVEQFPDKNPNPPPINGGLATAAQRNSNAIRDGLLPSSFQLSLSTTQAGIDLSAYMGLYIGGNNINWGAFGANNGGAAFSLGTAGIDARQFYGTLGTPTFGTVKIGRDIGLFASDAILNDLTLLGEGTPLANFTPGNTALGRIGIGYLYTDFIPQITYKTPSFGGFTAAVGLFTPYSEIPFSGDPESGTMTGHDVPGVQGQLKYVTTFGSDGKLQLSTSGIWQKHRADCQASIPTFGPSSCDTNSKVFVSENELDPGTSVDAWAVDGYGGLEFAGFNLVAYGYTGRGVGTTALFFDGVDETGSPRRSYGGYLQGAYTFNKVFTVGGSWGASFLKTASAEDAAEELVNCTADTTCLVRSNESWIGFARYKLTKWVNLQAEYVATRSKNQIGQTIRDNAVAVGTTFFW